MVIITAKPTFICMDEQGRLHHEDRAALEYGDGFCVYAWHGVRVPEWVILHPEEITVEKVLSEENQEVRRVMLERYGWDRLLFDLKAKVIHEDSTGKLVSTRRLSEYLDGEDDEARFVLVVDSSTDRRYALRVPPETCTAREGVAWTFCQDETKYMPIKEA
jgi:hypothetical protein